MTRATPGIPEPPRTVRPAAGRAYRRGLGNAGIALLVLGAALNAFVLARHEGGPLGADYWLDTGATTQPGKVLTVTNDREPGRVKFEFRTPAGHTYQGECFAPDAARFAGGTPEVEFLPDDPEVNRIVGTEAVHLDPWLGPLANITLALGLLGTAVWIRGSLQMNITLREGALAEAQVIEIREQGRSVALRYRFHDANGNEIIASHSVSKGQPFAQRLLHDEPRTVPVIYDHGEPGRNRAVAAEDFAEASA